MVKSMLDISCDVAIVGGGPGGSTTGALLRKYNPRLRVCIFEKEKFPREHVGESQLPPIGEVLNEMGCWEKVEAANFPVKIGATYRWGRNPELWDFEFLPLGIFNSEPRPGKYEGQRLQTAWQVERAIYDDILLKHAQELGCEVYEQSQVGEIEHEGDRVTALKLRDGRRVSARWHVDASGHVGVLRRAMGVQIDAPTQLHNIAIWDYWDNIEWAVEIGVGGTRIQVMSQPDGWLWFIPIGPTRASLGFVCPAEHFKSLGQTPEALYLDVVRRDERIGKLIANGKRCGPIRSTKDWSFVSERTFGENWFLVGEAAGFADPILSAGLTLTHTGARELAYTILALDEADHDAAWLKSSYCQSQRARVRQHIRFADYWYAANGQFTDLKAHCAAIARDSGMPMAPDAAWRWIAQGGFTNDVLGQPGLGAYDISGVKGTIQLFANRSISWAINDLNVFELDLKGANVIEVPEYADGAIQKITCYQRDGHLLPLSGVFGRLVDALHSVTDAEGLTKFLLANFRTTGRSIAPQAFYEKALQCLESMVVEGWVKGRLNRKKPRLKVFTPGLEDGRIIHKHNLAEEQAGKPG